MVRQNGKLYYFRPLFIGANLPEYIEFYSQYSLWNDDSPGNRSLYPLCNVHTQNKRHVYTREHTHIRVSVCAC